MQHNSYQDPMWNLDIHAIPIKIPIILFTDRKNNHKICMGLEKILNNQSNPEKEEQNRGHHAF